MLYPPTSNILNALREFFINVANPSDMGIDVYDGLKEKEAMLAQMTHEAISGVVGEQTYIDMELEVTEGIGKNGILEILMGDAQPINPIELTQMNLQFYIVEESNGVSSSSSSIGPTSTINADVYYQFFIIAAGGSLPLTSFSHNVEVLLKPLNSQVDWVEDDYTRDESYYESVGRVRFSDAGRYTLQLTMQHTTQDAYSYQQTISIEVV